MNSIKDDLENDQVSPGDKKHVPWALKQVAGYLKENLNGMIQTVLDVGAGDGYIAKHLPWKYTGIDPNPQADFVEKMVIEQIYNEFDLVIYNHVLEHIPNTDSQLRMAVGNIRSGGYLFIGVPEAGSQDKEWLLSAGHIHLFNTDIMTKLIHRIGLEIIDIRIEILKPGRREIWLLAKK